MNRKSLEIIVLGLGLVILGVSLYFTFTAAGDPTKLSLNTRILAFGFLVFVAFDFLNSRDWARKYAQLEEERDGLKEEKEALDAKLEASEQELKAEKDRGEELSKELASHKEEIEALENQLKSAKRSGKETAE